MYKNNNNRYRKSQSRKRHLLYDAQVTAFA